MARPTGWARPALSRLSLPLPPTPLPRVDGEAYWLGSAGAPSPESDARAFELGRMAEWRSGSAAPPGPQPVLATSLGELADLDSIEDQAEARRALLRTLEFLGAQRSATGELEVPTTLTDPGAPGLRLWPDEAPFAALREACEVLLRQIQA